MKLTEMKKHFVEGTSRPKRQPNFSATENTKVFNQSCMNPKVLRNHREKIIISVFDIRYPAGSNCLFLPCILMQKS